MDINLLEDFVVCQSLGSGTNSCVLFSPKSSPSPHTELEGSSCRYLGLVLGEATSPGGRLVAGGRGLEAGARVGGGRGLGVGGRGLVGRRVQGLGGLVLVLWLEGCLVLVLWLVGSRGWVLVVRLVRCRCRCCVLVLGLVLVLRLVAIGWGMVAMGRRGAVAGGEESEII